MGGGYKSFFGFGEICFSENCQKKMPQTLFDDWKNQVRKNLELEREQEEDPAKIFTRW